MSILASPLAMLKSEASALARKKGGILGRIIVRQDLHELELHYFPFFKVLLAVNIAGRKLPFLPKKTAKTSVHILVSGTTGSASVIQEFPALEPICAEACNLVEVLVSEEKILEHATKCVNKYVIRSTRTLPAVKDSQIDLFYRPYWVAYYGQKVEGQKIHYLPIQADGFNVATTF